MLCPCLALLLSRYVGEWQVKRARCKCVKGLKYVVQKGLTHRYTHKKLIEHIQYGIQKHSVAILGVHSLSSNSKLLKHVSSVLCAKAVRGLHFVSH